MAIQKKFNIPNAHLKMLSSGKLQPSEMMILVRITTAIHGPITEEIRGDFTPKVDGKIKKLLEMSAKETNR